MYIWGKGRAAGRVGSDFLSAIAGRVGSTFRRVDSGRVQEKWPVDNSDLGIECYCWMNLLFQKFRLERYI